MNKVDIEKANPLRGGDAKSWIFQLERTGWKAARPPKLLFGGCLFKEAMRYRTNKYKFTSCTVKSDPKL